MEIKECSASLGIKIVSRSFVRLKSASSLGRGTSISFSNNLRTNGCDLMMNSFIHAILNGLLILLVSWVFYGINCPERTFSKRILLD